MDLAPDVANLGIRLTEALTKRTATVIGDKVRALKTAQEQGTIIAGLEELVSDLISDKQEITYIAQAYQAELVSQRLSAGDVEYITKTVIPVLESVFNAPDDTSAESVQLEAVKSLLSTEAVNVLQLLGFDFRRAIGEPLTELVKRKILSNVDTSDELRLAAEESQHLFLKLAMDADAYERFHRMFPRE